VNILFVDDDLFSHFQCFFWGYRFCFFKSHREQLKKQEEMVARQEEMRRKTAEHEAQLRTKMELAKAQAEADGRIRQERENHDLILEKLKQEAMERRDTVLKSIQDAGKLIGEGLQSYLDDTTKLRNTAFTVTGIAIGVYTARTSIGIAGRFVEARLGKPSLVRETSRFSVGQAVRQPIPTVQRLLGMNQETDALKGIVLEPNLENQLTKIAVSTANTKKNKAPFRHLLLHGTSSSSSTGGTILNFDSANSDHLLSIHHLVPLSLSLSLSLSIYLSMQVLLVPERRCLPVDWHIIRVWIMLF
jgi:hypothetical protein